MKGFVLAIITFFTTRFSEIHFHSTCCAEALDAATTSYRPRSSTLLRVRKLVDHEAMALMPSKKADIIVTTENDEDKHRALVEELILKYAGGSTNYDWSLKAGSFSMMSYGDASFSYSFPPESMLSFSFPPVMGEFSMSFPSYSGATEMSFSYPEWPVETESSFSYPADAMSFSFGSFPTTNDENEDESLPITGGTSEGIRNKGDGIHVGALVAFALALFW
ncbi:hypothetical protein ACA910_022715 [Epithemia clementina (nom. ined.)]